MILKKLLLISIISYNSLAWAQENIHFIGLDKSGKEINATMSTKNTKTRLTQLISAMENKVNDLPSQSFPKNSMNLSKLHVGMGLGTALGLGSVLEVSASPSFYLIFGPK